MAKAPIRNTDNKRWPYEHKCTYCDKVDWIHKCHHKEGFGICAVCYCGSIDRDSGWMV